jgi:hypothetical protein
MLAQGRRMSVFGGGNLYFRIWLGVTCKTETGPGMEQIGGMVDHSGLALLQENFTAATGSRHFHHHRSQKGLQELFSSSVFERVLLQEAENRYFLKISFG